MRTDLFDFELPEEQIAAYPVGEHGRDRLLVLDRASGRRDHRLFSDIPEYLREGDLLVVNDTRVRKARLEGRRETGGKVEIMLLSPVPDSGSALWLALTKSSRPVKPGTVLTLEPELECEIVSREEKTARIRFSRPLTEDDIERLGKIPLPPYIVSRRKKTGRLAEWDDDEFRYQTVFARETGAVAAPTAGLHFTPELLDRVRAAGIGLCRITLEVGWGTFAPVEADTIGTHRLHEERYHISEQAATLLNTARTGGGRIVAVGTTVVRTLESAFTPGGFVPVSSATDIFIKPGYEFRAVDALVTNFHTPRSTLLMLVSSFAGRERVLDAYGEAVEKGYRFYSYGDAMLIL